MREQWHPRRRLDSSDRSSSFDCSPRLSCRPPSTGIVISIIRTTCLARRVQLISSTLDTKQTWLVDPSSRRFSHARPRICSGFSLVLLAVRPHSLLHSRPTLLLSHARPRYSATSPRVAPRSGVREVGGCRLCHARLLQPPTRTVMPNAHGTVFSAGCG